MGCDVDKTAVLSLLPKNFGGRLRPEKNLCIRKNCSHRTDLIRDAGCRLVRDPQQQGSPVARGDTVMTERINTGARSIGNGKRIYQGSLSVKQCAEGQMVHQIMRNKDQMTSLQPLADRGNQLIDKAFLPATAEHLRELFNRLLALLRQRSQG